MFGAELPAVARGEEFARLLADMWVEPGPLVGRLGRKRAGLERDHNPDGGVVCERMELATTCATSTPRRANAAFVIARATVRATNRTSVGGGAGTQIGVRDMVDVEAL